MPRMYTTPDEARSDLYLAGAVYLFGDLLLGVFLRLVPLGEIPYLGVAILALLPLVTTIVVPYLLIRYRKERLADYGLTGPSPLFLRGLLIGVPLVVAAVVGGLLAGPDSGLGMPLVTLALTGSVFEVVNRLAFFFGVTLLAIYATVKARDAFRADPSYVASTMVRIGRVLAVVSAAASVLLALSTVVAGENLLGRSALLLYPLAVGGSAWLAHREVTGRQVTSRAILLTPAVVFALGAFFLSFDAYAFTFGVWRASYLAGLGLIVGVLVESQRSAWGPLGLATVMALLTYL